MAYDARHGGDVPRWAPTVQFADYAVWVRNGWRPKTMASPNGTASWPTGPTGSTGRPSCSGCPPTGRGRRRRRIPPARWNRRSPAELVARLTETARTANATLFMITHAALAVLLAKGFRTHRYRDRQPVCGRGAQALDDVVGMFVNTVAFRTGWIQPHRSTTSSAPCATVISPTWPTRTWRSRKW